MPVVAGLPQLNNTEVDDGLLVMLDTTGILESVKEVVAVEEGPAAFTAVTPNV